MSFLDWAALILGVGLIASGVRAIRRRQASVPERYEGHAAVRLGWLWIGLGALFVLAVMFDVETLRTLFRLFLEAAN
jgi:cell division protein FtsW (lipid II flippase)